MLSQSARFSTSVASTIRTSLKPNNSNTYIPLIFHKYKHTPSEAQEKYQGTFPVREQDYADLNIVEVVGREHSNLKEQFQKFLQAGKTEEKTQLAKQFMDDYFRLSKIEDAVLLPFMRDNLPDGYKVSMQLGVQHKQLVKQLDEISKEPPNSVKFDVDSIRIIKNIMTHMDKEQNEMYRLVSSLHPDVLKEQTKEWYRKKLELEEKERTTKKVRRRTKGFNDGPDVGFP